jgi:poly(hydroxyalkanoate) depolymerase family esterase
MKKKILTAIGCLILFLLPITTINAEDLVVGSTTRNMIVYAPSNIPQNRPLIISLHGMSQDAAYQKAQAKWETIADTAKFVVVFPNGINNQWNLSGTSDIDFITAIIDNMKTRYGIDRNRVYLSGFSMGGMMTYYAATKIADKIAAFAPISGYLMGGPNTNSSRPIPIIHTHGTSDDVVGYSGVQTCLNAWITRNGCPTTAVVTDPYPANNPNSICTKSYWGLGTNGVAMVLMTLEGKGHWISNDQVNGIHTSAEIWKFCKAFTLPGTIIQENTTGFCSVDGTIDSNNAGYTGSGFANTNNATGAGINWRVNFATSGSKTFTFKYASTDARSANLIINGTTVASNINFPSTGSWTTWSTVSVTATVNSGTYSVRLQATGASGLGNIDYLEVIGGTSAACGSVTSATIQENSTGFCSVDGTVASTNAGFTGTGYADTNAATSAGVSWSVNIPSTGAYTLKWRYASTSNRPANLKIDGFTVVSNLAFASTGSWTTWAETGTTSVNLAAGNRVIRIEATTTSGLGNIDNMTITGISPTGVACSGLKSATLEEMETDLQEIPVVIKTEYFNLIGQPVTYTDKLKGIFILRMHMSDGSVISSKKLIR